MARAQEGGDGGVRLEFPDAPLSVLVDFYETLSEKRVVRAASLGESTVTVVYGEPLPREEALRFIESTLLLHGFALVPADERTLKLFDAEMTSPRSLGLEVVHRPDELPPGDGVVNFVMPLEFISPEEAVRTFSSVVDLNSYGAITPLNNANAVVITENASIIRSLIELRDHVDVPPNQVDHALVNLSWADAGKIAEIIGAIFENQTGLLVGNTESEGEGGEGGEAVSSERSDVMIIPYERTNGLMVVARSVDVDYIESLARAFDQPSATNTFTKRKLQFVSVIDYLPAFYNALLRNTDVDTREDLLVAEESTAGPSSRDLGAERSSGAGIGGEGSAVVPDRLSEPEPFTPPKSYVIGNTLLLADPQANSLIVSGSPEHIAIIEELIAQIDVQPRQVYISTVIGQLNLGDEREWSLNAFKQFDSFEVAPDRPEQTFGAGSFDPLGNNVVRILGTFADPALFPGTSSGLALAGRIVQGDNEPIDLVVEAVARDNKFRLLSRPSIYAQNNTKAVILSGQRIAVPVSSLTSVNNGLGAGGFPGSIASNIDYLDVVLKLEVVPLINSDDEVTLRIAQVNDTISGSQIVSGNEVPTLNTQELITTVTVNHGEIIVLGGLITEKEDEARAGIPVVRKIPIVGKLAGSSDLEFRREELLIFIQPLILDEEESRLPTRPNDVEAYRTESYGDGVHFADPHCKCAVGFEGGRAEGRGRARRRRLRSPEPGGIERPLRMDPPPDEPGRCREEGSRHPQTTPTGAERHVPSLKSGLHRRRGDGVGCGKVVARSRRLIRRESGEMPEHPFFEDPFHSHGPRAIDPVFLHSD